MSGKRRTNVGFFSLSTTDIGSFTLAMQCTIGEWLPARKTAPCQKVSGSEPSPALPNAVAKAVACAVVNALANKID